MSTVALDERAPRERTRTAGAVALEWLAPLLAGALLFAAVAPTLRWFEFYHGSETLNVATALEMRRGGRWLLPTLQGQPRTQKPPLTAWVTAWAVRDDTLRGMSSLHAAERDRAARDLAVQVRWPPLLAASLMLVAVYATGAILGGRHIGAVAALACATSLLLLRYARLSITDVHLALWVAVANAAIAWAVVRGRWWGGCLLGGAALGLAVMSKGPVALVQTVLPWSIYVIWKHRVAPDDRLEHPRRARRWPPLVVGVVVALLVAAPWFIYVATNSGGGIVRMWASEVTRVGATDLEPDPWFNYLMVIPLMFPWSVLLVVGLVVAALHARERRAEPLLAAALLFVVPILVMSFFKDRKDRYLLPMAGPAAIVAAWGVVETLGLWRSAKRQDALVRALHWGGLLVMVVAVPVMGSIGWPGAFRTAGGAAWYELAHIVAPAVALIALVIAGVVLQRRWPVAIVVTTVLTMLAGQVLLARGYARARGTRSEMKPLADAVWTRAPGASVYSMIAGGRRAPSDLSIYLNRIVEPIRAVPSQPAARDEVLVFLQRDGEPAPKQPPGWDELATVPRGRHVCHAFVRRARAPVVCETHND